MSNKKYLIDDAQIISLYQEGHSQNDIITQNEIPVWYVRKVLKNAGFDTDSFRCLDNYVIDIVILLIRNGILFQDIVEICDISYYTIRDIVRKNNLQYVSKKVRHSSTDAVIDPVFDKSSEFMNAYNAGSSFCCICRDLGLSDKEILSAFHLIRCSDLSEHKQALTSIIIATYEQNFSITAIARKNLISISVVRNVIKGKKL